MKKNITFFTVLFLLASVFTPMYSQSQIGADIDGEEAGDEFGEDVSLSSDGSRLAVGATGNEEGEYVQVFDLIGGAWTQVGENITGDDTNDFFGGSVSLSSDGSRLAVGAPQIFGSNGFFAGYVQVYEYTGGSWAQVGDNIDGAAVDDMTGFSVSLSADGSRVVVGGFENDGAGEDAGHARVFEETGGTWSQVGGDIEGAAADDNLGFSVSISADGSMVAASAPASDGNGETSGSVMVYGESGGTWSQIGSRIDGEVAGDFSGNAIALSADGSRVIIGAPSNGDNGDFAGHARVYELSGGDWAKLGSDIDGEAMFDFCGQSVGISADGNRVAVGAQLNDGNGDESGHVRVFEFVSGDWVQLGEDIDGEAEEDFSGFSLSLSSDGSKVAIGAVGNDGNGDNAGHVRVYEMFTVPVEEIGKENTFEISPNPTNGKIQILGFEYESIKIMDRFGRTLMEEKTYQSEIDISALSSGVYFIQIGSKNQSVTKRIIKE